MPRPPLSVSRPVADAGHDADHVQAFNVLEPRWPMLVVTPQQCRWRREWAACCVCLVFVSASGDDAGRLLVQLGEVTEQPVGCVLRFLRDTVRQRGTSSLVRTLPSSIRSSTVVLELV